MQNNLESFALWTYVNVNNHVVQFHLYIQYSTRICSTHSLKHSFVFIVVGEGWGSYAQK